jgi:hypothetical protein
VKQTHGHEILLGIIDQQVIQYLAKGNQIAWSSTRDKSKRHATPPESAASVELQAIRKQQVEAQIFLPTCLTGQ